MNSSTALFGFDCDSLFGFDKDEEAKAFANVIDELNADAQRRLDDEVIQFALNSANVTWACRR